MAVNASWPGVSMNVMSLPSRSAWYAPMCWVMPPASPDNHVGLADLVEQQRLAVVDVAHHRDDRWARAEQALVLLLVVLEVLGLELGFLLLAGLDEADLGADLGGEQLDGVVGQRHRGRHHLALLQQEAHDVGRRTVQLRPDVLRGGPAFDDDLAFGHRRGGRHVVRERGGLELVLGATPTTPALRRTATAAGTTTASEGTTGATATAGTAGHRVGRRNRDRRRCGARHR